MSEAGYLFDASAILAIVFDEPGAEHAAAVLLDARISAVNLSEVVAKLYDRKMEKDRVDQILSNFSLDSIPFDGELADQAGHLRPLTRHLGLSLGDRACLATAAATGRTVLTADQAWIKLDLGIAIELLR